MDIFLPSDASTNPLTIKFLKAVKERRMERKGSEIKEKRRGERRRGEK